MTAAPSAASVAEPSSVYRVGQHSVRLLMAVGDLLVGWLLLRQADVALTALGGAITPKDQAFYEGKIGAARFFTATVLPRLTTERAIVAAADNTLMDLADDSF